MRGRVGWCESKQRAVVGGLWRMARLWRGGASMVGGFRGECFPYLWRVLSISMAGTGADPWHATPLWRVTACACPCACPCAMELREHRGGAPRGSTGHCVEAAREHSRTCCSLRIGPTRHRRAANSDRDGGPSHRSIRSDRASSAGIDTRRAAHRTACTVQPHALPPPGSAGQPTVHAAPCDRLAPRRGRS